MPSRRAITLAVLIILAIVLYLLFNFSVVALIWSVTGITITLYLLAMLAHFQALHAQYKKNDENPPKPRS